MTEAEFIEIARKRYQQIESLSEKESFYEYEKAFELIMLEMSGEILEKSLGELPKDTRKKKGYKPGLA